MQTTAPAGVADHYIWSPSRRLKIDQALAVLLGQRSTALDLVASECVEVIVPALPFQREPLDARQRPAVMGLAQKACVVPTGSGSAG